MPLSRSTESESKSGAQQFVFYQALQSGSDAHSSFTSNHRFSYLLIGPLSIPSALVWTINYMVTLNIAMLPKIFCQIIPFPLAGSSTHTPRQPTPRPWEALDKETLRLLKN